MIKLILIVCMLIQQDTVKKDSLITPQGKVAVYTDSKGKLYILRGNKKQYITKNNVNIVRK